MKNTIYTDADLLAFLARGEEYDGNIIEIVFDADDTQNQTLEIVAGTISTIEQITSSAQNIIQIPQVLWNLSGQTAATLYKNGEEANTIIISFPDAIDAGAGLNEVQQNEYKIDGSSPLQEQINSLKENVVKVSMQTLSYIYPKWIDQTDIPDNTSNTIEHFELDAEEEGGAVTLISQIQFLANTTENAGVFDDFILTASVILDGNAVATLIQTYRDGRQILTINQIIENLSKGNHELELVFACQGGAVDLMQITTAFVLAAKSTGDTYQQEYKVFTEGDWSPGVLFDGLEQSMMTEEAKRTGVEESMIKYSRANTVGASQPPINTLSGWFNTKYILCNGQYYAEPFWETVDGYFRKDGNSGNIPTTEGRVGSTTVDFWIPIKRVNGYTRLYYEQKIVKYSGVSGDHDYNLGLVGVGAVINGTMQLVRGPSSSTLDWTAHTVDISSLPYVDYIVFEGIDGSQGYRNISLIK